MTFRKKLRYYANDMAERGVNLRAAAPPLHRFLWKMGVEVPPPLFQSFASHLLLAAAVVAVGVSAAAWVVVLLMGVSTDSLPRGLALGVGVGLLFGTLQALVSHVTASRLGLPSWDEYPEGRGRAARRGTE